MTADYHYFIRPHTNERWLNREGKPLMVHSNILEDVREILSPNISITVSEYDEIFGK